MFKGHLAAELGSVQGGVPVSARQQEVTILSNRVTRVMNTDQEWGAWVLTGVERKWPGR